MDDLRAREQTERAEILATLDDWLETPLVILGMIWLVLLIIEFIWGLSPLLAVISDAIWIVFIVDFALKLLLAPRRIEYLKENWLTAVALALPALRIFRIFRVIRIARAARFARGVRLVRVLTSINRGLRAIGASFGRRGFSYVLATTMVVLFAGAAGMYAFESEVPNTEIDSYGSALWWTAMLLTSIGAETFPKTAEGRVLSLLIALYGFAVFGYVTATLASFFVESDARSKNSAVPDAQQLDRIESELAGIREAIRSLRESNG